jgi:DNA-binding phage protein
VAEIAADFGVTPQTVYRALMKAETPSSTRLRASQDRRAGPA